MEGRLVAHTDEISARLMSAIRVCAATARSKQRFGEIIDGDVKSRKSVSRQVAFGERCVAAALLGLCERSSSKRAEIIAVALVAAAAAVGRATVV